MSDLFQGVIFGGVFCSVFSWIYSGVKKDDWNERLQRGMFEWNGEIYKVEKVGP